MGAALIHSNGQTDRHNGCNRCFSRDYPHVPKYSLLYMSNILKQTTCLQNVCCRRGKKIDSTPIWAHVACHLFCPYFMEEKCVITQQLSAACKQSSGVRPTLNSHGSSQPVAYQRIPYFLNIVMLICGNKMPTRCNRGFYCRPYCLLNMFRALLCPSSGAQEYYTVVAACGILCCGFQVAGLVWS